MIETYKILDQNDNEVVSQNLFIDKDLKVVEVYFDVNLGILYKSRNDLKAVFN